MLEKQVTLNQDEVLVATINNPLDLSDFTRVNHIVTEEMTTATFAPVIMNEVIISLNGAIIEFEDRAKTKVVAGDSIVICPVPQGGSGSNGKVILRLVAMIALVAIAPVLAGFIPGAATALIAGTSLTLGNLYALGIVMVGNMLINTLLPIAPVGMGTGTDLDDSPTYGISGPATTASEAATIGCGYGSFRAGGNRIATHVENIGDDQFLYMLINAGEGPIGGIGDIRLNDQPIDNFQDTVHVMRYGNASQSVIPWFNESVIPITKSIQLNNGLLVHTTTNPIERFSVDLTAPAGLVHLQKDGDKDSVSVDIVIQYRKVGDTLWKSIGDRNKVISYDTTYRYADTGTEEATLRPGTYTNAVGMILDAQGNMVGNIVRTPVYKSVITMRERTHHAVRRSYDSPELPYDTYEIAVFRVSAESTNDRTSDVIMLSTINEITLDKVSYKHCALLGIKIRMSEQLSSVPNVTFIHGGRIVKVRSVENNVPVWTLAASENPAWIAYDILTNQRVGGSIAESRVDIEMWQDWADHCDAQGLVYSGNFDQPSNIWDALQYVFRVGHAQIVNVGTKYSVAIERADDPVMMFNVANIVEKSFGITWLPTTDRANEIEVTYYDEENDFERSHIRVRDPSLSPGKEVRTATMQLYGVKHKQQAINEAIFQLNMNKHILQTVQFDALLETIACTVGSQILVQHDLPLWDFGGRCETGSTSSIIQVDRPLTIQAGVTQNILITYDSLQRATGTVDSVNSNLVWLNSFAGDPRVARLIIGTKDYRVERVINDGGAGYGVQIEDASAVTAGQTYQLFDTDVIEEREVTNPPGETTAVTVGTPLPAPPSQYAKWMFGDVTKVKRPFRVIAITGSSDYKRSITAVEYNANIYDVANGVVLPDPVPGQLISHVQSLSIDQTYNLVGGAYVPVANLGWDLPVTGVYGGVDVYLSKNGGPYQKIGQASSRENTFEYPLTIGTDAFFKVVAFDVVGSRAPYGSAPTIAFTGVARPDIDMPTSLNVTTIVDAYVLKWTPPTGAFSLIEIHRSTVDNYQVATLLDKTTNNTYIDHVDQGTKYYYWVRSVSLDGITSEFSTWDGFTAPGTTAIAPGTIQNLGLISPFVSDSVSIRWDFLAEASGYIVDVIANGSLSRSVTLLTSEYTYTIGDARNDANIGREITFRVKARLVDGTVGPQSELIATNPQVSAAPGNITLTSAGDSFAVNFAAVTDPDIAGYKIWASQTLGFTPGVANLAYDGRSNGAVLAANPGEDWYAVVAAYDIWGDSNVVQSIEAAVYVSNPAFDIAVLSDAITRTELAASLEGEIDALESEYTVKVSARTSDGTPYIAGFGVSVEAGASGALSSNFLVKADTFAIMPSALSSVENPTLPFIVSGGIVYINSAMIEDASITNAMIGNVIQSNNYTPSTGWKIDKSGAAEFSQIVIRDSNGDVIMQSGGTITALGLLGAGLDVSDINMTLGTIVTEFAESFESDEALGNWVNYSGTGEMSIIPSTLSSFGGNILQVGNNSGNDQAWILHKRLIPFDPGRSYRIRVSARQSAGTGKMYAGWAGVAADGVTLVSSSGLDSHSGQHYHCMSGVDVPSVFTEYVGYTEGYGATAGSSTLGLMHPDVRYLRPLILVNYSGLPGVTYVDSFIMESKTGGGTWADLVAEDGKIGSGNIGGIIDSQAITGTYIKDATIVNAKIANVIQSNTYSAGSTGWKIDKAGIMEMNSATFRGTIDVKSASSGARLQIKNNVIKVYDSSGVLRVQIGDLNA